VTIRIVLNRLRGDKSVTELSCKQTTLKIDGYRLPIRKAQGERKGHERMRPHLFAYVGILLGSCSPSKLPIACPDPALVAPASIGGASAVTGLTALLNGPDRLNTIKGAAARFRKRDPSITNSVITDIIIAADCPNLMASGVPSAHDERARIAATRAQVTSILSR
jgi:hypothetical protein